MECTLSTIHPAQSLYRRYCCTTLTSSCLALPRTASHCLAQLRMPENACVFAVPQSRSLAVSPSRRLAVSSYRSPVVLLARLPVIPSHSQSFPGVLSHSQPIARHSVFPSYSQPFPANRAPPSLSQPIARHSVFPSYSQPFPANRAPPSLSQPIARLLAVPAVSSSRPSVLSLSRLNTTSFLFPKYTHSTFRKCSKTILYHFAIIFAATPKP